MEVSLRLSLLQPVASLMSEGLGLCFSGNLLSAIILCIHYNISIAQSLRK